MRREAGDARFLWVFPSIAVLTVILILIINGFPHGRDWPYELTRIAEMREAFVTGQSPPFWAPDEYHGFGSPVFIYYAPLFATVASFFTMLLEIPDAAVVAIALAVIAAALMMYGAVAEVAGPQAARFAVIAFALHPYLLADIWIRNANAEFLALALLPGVIAGAISPLPWRRFWWTFLSLAVVILAHNLTSLVATAMLLCIVIFVHRAARALLPTAAGVVAALAVTSFFWVPAVVLRSLAVREDALTAGRFDFHNLFPRPLALIVLNPPHEYFSGGFLGVLMLAALIAAAIGWRGGDAHARRVVRACAIAAVVLILLMLRISVPVWEHLPLMHYLQFPFRLVGPLAVVTIIGFAMLIPTASTQRIRFLEVIFLAAAIVSALPVILIYPRMERAEMQRFTALLTPSGIREHGLRTVVADDYLPVGARLSSMRMGREPIAFVTEGMSVVARDARGGNAHIVVSSANGGVVAFRRWFYPVWQASVDAASVAVHEMPGGVAGVTVPAGQHDVRLTLVEPLVRTITKAASAIAAVAIFAIVLLVRRVGERASRPQ